MRCVPEISLSDYLIDLSASFKLAYLLDFISKKMQISKRILVPYKRNKSSTLSKSEGVKIEPVQLWSENITRKESNFTQ